MVPASLMGGHSQTAPIDVWNTETFDAALLAELNSERDLLRDYALTDRRQFLEREAVSDWTPHATNPYAAARNDFVERVVMPAMECRSMRAWHYTRLTDDETSLLRTDGVFTSDLQTIRRRLDAQVSAGVLSAVTADALYAASPFHRQNDSRAGKFWMTSHPVSADNSLVELLLGGTAHIRPAAGALGWRGRVFLAQRSRAYRTGEKSRAAARHRSRGAAAGYTPRLLGRQGRRRHLHAVTWLRAGMAGLRPVCDERTRPRRSAVHPHRGRAELRCACARLSRAVR